MKVAAASEGQGKSVQSQGASDASSTPSGKDKTAKALYLNVLETGNQWSPVLEFFTLVLICVLAFFLRLFAVIRFESVIHEFDPYFNFRTSIYLSKEGFYEFWNWFDDGSWYPLGRVIGQTLYPGLMTTASVLYSVLNFFGLIVNIRNVCVFLAPIFSGFTAIASYLFTKEVSGRPEAGLLSALLMALVPSYVSRSVAGSYDNEAVAIFALLFAFYVVIKAVNRGSVLWATLACLAYFYMVSSWGAYVFVLNVVTLFELGMLLLGRMTSRIFVVYQVYYIVGTVLCLNVPFVNFNAIFSSEHMISHGVFVLLNVYMMSGYLRAMVPKATIQNLLKVAAGIFGVCFVVLFIWLSLTKKTSFGGRSLTLLDPSYAAKFVPIIASVSEHQPTTWSTYIFDIHVLIGLVPIGLFVALRRLTDGLIFASLYGILAVYFSGVMIRLMLVYAPAAATLAGIGGSFVIAAFMSKLRPTAFNTSATSSTSSANDNSGNNSQKKKAQPAYSISERVTAVAVLCALFWVFVQYVLHSSWVSSFAYSNPSIVLAHQMRDGSRLIQDDFREAYDWLKRNTDQKARVMSWWDYGYQITAMGNRTVLVDNNTWNNTHIATVGLMFASDEETAYPLLLRHDVNYVLVVCGAYSRYHSDDINKFMWMIRIAQGVYPHIQETDYLAGGTRNSVGPDAPQAMLNSLMYKLNYYRVDEVTRGYDYARNMEVGDKHVTLKHLKEAFTSENWIVRIYSVNPPPNRQF